MIKAQLKHTKRLHWLRWACIVDRDTLSHSHSRSLCVSISYDGCAVRDAVCIGSVDRKYWLRRFMCAARLVFVCKSVCDCAIDNKNNDDNWMKSIKVNGKNENDENTENGRDTQSLTHTNEARAHRIHHKLQSNFHITVAPMVFYWHRCIRIGIYRNAQQACIVFPRHTMFRLVFDTLNGKSSQRKRIDHEYTSF